MYLKVFLLLLTKSQMIIDGDVKNKNKALVILTNIGNDCSFILLGPQKLYEDSISERLLNFY